MVLRVVAGRLNRQIAEVGGADRTVEAQRALSAREKAERREARGEQVGPKPRGEQEGTPAERVGHHEAGAERRAFSGASPCTRHSGLHFMTSKPGSDRQPALRGRSAAPTPEPPG